MQLQWMLLATIFYARSVIAKEHAHKITSLPYYADSNPINFNQYAGHIKLHNGPKMFYWFVESESNPDTDPVVLWLNGGPGCSSLGGFFTENGPFVVNGDLTIKRNTYAWNRKVNMLYLESPAGVGFSQPVVPADEYNDAMTTARAYDFLDLFFQEYDTFASRPFFITGESYAGMYIPFLAHKLVQEPLRHVNFQGFAIGNPYTDDTIDGNAYMDYYYSHAMISLENYEALQNACRDQIGMCMNSPDHVGCSVECDAALAEANRASNTDALNPYYIFGDVCLLQNHQAKFLHYRDYRPMHRGSIGPCTDVFTQNYLQLREVQEAIHVSGEHVKWTDCNDYVSDTYARSASSLPVYPTILAAQPSLKVLIYSGDADAIVNFVGTQRWITRHGLKLAVVDKWRSWFGPDKQLAGYTQTYDGLVFKTVKGAGHMVPSVRPLHALYMFECFVYGDAACQRFEYPQDNLEYLTGENLAGDTLVNTEQQDKTTATETASTQQQSPTTYAATPTPPEKLTAYILVVAVGCAAAATVYKRQQTSAMGYMRIEGRVPQPRARPHFQI